MQPFAMARDDAVRQRLLMATVPAIRSIFKRDNVGLRGQILTSWDRGPPTTWCTGSHARRAASVASSYPKAMPSPAASAALPFRARSLPGALLAQTGSQRGSQTSSGRRLEQDRAAIGTALALIKLRNHRPPQKYLGRANTLLWYVRSSEGLTFGLKPAQTTVLYHARPFRASKIMNFPG